MEKELDLEPYKMVYLKARHYLHCCLIYYTYTSDVPPTTSRKFIYADDTALGVQDKGLLKCQEVLEEDLLIMSEYGACNLILQKQN